MGYTTEFTGSISITPPLSAQEQAYLEKFAGTRRMERTRGPYFVGGTGFAGQGHDPDILDYNQPPAGQPGLWCQWVANAEGDALVWDEGEKFYYAPEWMQYLIDHFLGKTPIVVALYPELGSLFTGHSLSGRIEAQGEDAEDRWSLIVQDNQVFVDEGGSLRAVGRASAPQAVDPKRLPPAPLALPEGLPA